MKALKFLPSIFCLILFLIIGIMASTLDVAAVGPMNTSVGLSTLNLAIFEATSTSESWYLFTQALGLVALGIVGIFAMVGLIELIRRKSLRKVDGEIIGLGILYIITLGLYFLFDIVAVNYRPIIMSGESVPEPSFPSSHTLLVLVVMIGLMTVTDTYITATAVRAIVRITSTIICLLMVIGRLLSGVHWFTDILAGVLLGLSLGLAYRAWYRIYKKI